MNDKAAELERNKKTLVSELARLKNNQTKRMSREDMVMLFIDILKKQETEEDFAKFLIKEFVKSVYVSEEEILIYYSIGNDNEPHRLQRPTRTEHKRKVEPLNSADSFDNGVRISNTMGLHTIMSAFDFRL